MAGKLLYERTLHVQTISDVLRPVWANLYELKFRSIGENMFVAILESKQDLDRVWKAHHGW